ncbi:hypothetical protein IFM89_036392 [Coptis chinensis]|uniref:ARM repeat superfamily protein n=1 Tax=Coptis chinensis TaxID=261450 RepID=A0A835IGK7_9MAGN|nr:hypothetical protein IFM89_036392 [Coptis chinensis]
MVAVLISKIARVDYPREWPELFSVLAQQLQSADVLTSHRIFMAKGLHQNDWQAILSAFSALTQSFASNAPVEHQDDLYLTCERWLFCLKVVRQLIISGFQSDAKSMQEVRPVKEVCPVLLNAIQLFLPYYSSFLERHHKFCDFTKRLCTKLVKVLVSVQGRHPYSFGDECVLRPVMDFCLARITNPEQEIESFEQFQIQCMIMVKTILECKEYKPSLIGRVINENGVSREQMKKVAVCDVLASLLPGEMTIARDIASITTSARSRMKEEVHPSVGTWLQLSMPDPRANSLYSMSISSRFTMCSLTKLKVKIQRPEGYSISHFKAEDDILVSKDSSAINDVMQSELWLLAKHNMDNRVIIAHCGAIPPLISLLYSVEKLTQEHAVTTLLNLSINENNKNMIAEVGAREPLIHVLKSGNAGAKGNGVATLFNLYVLEEYKMKIGRSAAVKALVDLLESGTLRGKKDVATALFNLSIFHAGAVKHLIELMDPDVGMIDKCVALLANLSTIPEGRSAITR